MDSFKMSSVMLNSTESGATNVACCVDSVDGPVLS